MATRETRHLKIAGVPESLPSDTIKSHFAKYSGLLLLLHSILSSPVLDATRCRIQLRLLSVCTLAVIFRQSVPKLGLKGRPSTILTQFAWPFPRHPSQTFRPSSLDSFLQSGASRCRFGKVQWVERAGEDVKVSFMDVRSAARAAREPVEMGGSSYRAAFLDSAPVAAATRICAPEQPSTSAAAPTPARCVLLSQFESLHYL